MNTSRPTNPNNLTKLKGLFSQASAFDQAEIPDMPIPQPVAQPASTGSAESLRAITFLLDDALADLSDGFPEEASTLIREALAIAEKG